MADVNAGTNRLIGRDRELATLGSFLGEAVGLGATLLLTGEPGVGKTALLVAAAEMATAEGVRVIRGGGVEYESDIGFVGCRLRAAASGCSVPYGLATAAFSSAPGCRSSTWHRC
jgi:predicted ATP-dependent serine protease